VNVAGGKTSLVARKVDRGGAVNSQTKSATSLPVSLREATVVLIGFGVTAEVGDLAKSSAVSCDEHPSLESGCAERIPLP
jgi:hypothetical protein